MYNEQPSRIITESMINKLITEAENSETQVRRHLFIGAHWTCLKLIFKTLDQAHFLVYNAGSRIIENNLRGCFVLYLAPLVDSKTAGPYPNQARLT